MIYLPTKENCETSQWLFYTNMREELEVLILGLRLLDPTKLSREQGEALSMCLGTLESQLWNRYYRWDNQK